VPGGLPEDHVLARDPWWDDSDPTDVTTPPGSRRFRRPLLGFAVLVGIVFFLVAHSRVAYGPDAASYLSTPGALATVAPDQRIRGPQLRGRLLDGSAFDASGWQGNIVVVNFWGSWCAPCRAETPELVRVANGKYSRGVRFLGIDVRDNRAAATAFVQQYHVPYPSIFDSDGQATLAFRGLPPNAVPTTFVLDQQNRIAARALGRITAAQLLDVLKTLELAAHH
jgi:thiol-disulfide isomerase/thioredoxin